MDIILSLGAVYFAGVFVVMVSYIVIGGLQGGIIHPLSALEEAGTVGILWPFIPFVLLWVLARAINDTLEDMKPDI